MRVAGCRGVAVVFVMLAVVGFVLFAMGGGEGREKRRRQGHGA
jgi:hypothetical protein